MKSRPEKPGVLRSATRLLTHNWALKLLSLALAVLIYYALKPTGEGRPRGADRGTAFPGARVIEHVTNVTPEAVRETATTP